MGLMDFASQLLGGGDAGQDPKARLITAAIGMIQNHPGGLQGLLGQFQESGLTDHVSSWVGTGENLPISGEQVQQALGQEQVQSLAQAAEVAPEHASSGLAALLPEIINHLTPNGQVPQGQDAGQGLQALLPGLLGKLLG
jgi:uncharacterized protein YidB (DUF937 family)